MKEEEFNLSEKMNDGDSLYNASGAYNRKGGDFDWIYKKDVKEFIRRLKEGFDVEGCDLNPVEVLEEIDRLAGSKLVEGSVKRGCANE